MPSSNDASYTSNATDERTVGAIERTARPVNRREMLKEQRQGIVQHKQTDVLPQVNGDASGKNAWRYVTQLREENKRLRAELSSLQQGFEKELAALRSSHQQQVEEYQNHLRDLMEEHNRMQEAQLALERRYQELYHNFQDAVEDEAGKMITEAVRTVEITPEHTPLLLRDVKKTIELQRRQEEDQQVAQALYLMREAQRKAQQLEQELDRERRQMMTERQNLLNLQNSIRSQAQLRFDVQKTRLRAQWIGAVTVVALISIVLFLFVQGLAFSYFGHSLPTASLVAIIVSGILSFIMARIWLISAEMHASAPHKKTVVHPKEHK